MPTSFNINPGLTALASALFPDPSSQLDSAYKQAQTEKITQEMAMAARAEAEREAASESLATFLIDQNPVNPRLSPAQAEPTSNLTGLDNTGQTVPVPARAKPGTELADTLLADRDQANGVFHDALRGAADFVTAGGGKADVRARGLNRLFGGIGLQFGPEEDLRTNATLATEKLPSATTALSDSERDLFLAHDLDQILLQNQGDLDQQALSNQGALDRANVQADARIETADIAADARRDTASTRGPVAKYNVFVPDEEGNLTQVGRSTDAISLLDGSEIPPNAQVFTIGTGRSSSTTVGPDGTVTISDSAPGAGGGSKKLTEGQARVGEFVQRMRKGDQDLNTILTESGVPGVFDFYLASPKEGTFGTLISNYLASADGQAYSTAAQTFLNAILRRDTGAAAPLHEYPLYWKQFIPMPGDDKDVITLKNQNRVLTMEAMAQNTGWTQQDIDGFVATLPDVPPPPGFQEAVEESRAANPTPAVSVEEAQTQFDRLKTGGDHAQIEAYLDSLPPEVLDGLR